MRTIVLALSFLGLLLNPAYAQSILGRALVDGRTVLILSDGTWRYEDGPATASGDCNLVALDLSFCGSSGTWIQVTPSDPEITAAYRFDDLHYGQIIAEGFGSDHGLDIETMRGIVIKNAAGASGRTASDIPVLDIRPAKIDEMEAETVVFLVKLESVSVVYANTILILPRRTFQVGTYSIGSQFTDKHRDIHADFLEHIRFE